MTAVNAKPRKKVEDLVALPEGVRAELIEGDIFPLDPTPSPRRIHQRALAAIHLAMASHLASTQQGTVDLGPIPVRFPSGDLLEADLVFLRRGHPSASGEHLQGSPDLVVEVLSAQSRVTDRLIKKHIYERNCVSEYWIVDPGERAVEVFRLQTGRYEPAGYLREGETLATPLAPGLSIAVAGIFARLW